jgi:hypothetical protein
VYAQFLASGFHRDSVFWTLIDKDKIYEGISHNLEPDSPAPEDSAVPTVPLFNSTGTTVVIVRVLSVKEDDDDDTDFFTQITIGDQEFIDAVQRNEDEIEPFWASMKFLPPSNNSASTINVLIQLFDEDSITSNDPYDINPSESATDLTLQFNLATHELTGDFQGVCNTSSNPCVFSGCEQRDNSATISFYIASFQIEDTISTQFDIPPGAAPGKSASCPDKRAAPQEERQQNRRGLSLHIDKEPADPGARPNQHIEYHHRHSMEQFPIHLAYIGIGMVCFGVALFLLLGSYWMVKQVCIIARDSADMERAQRLTSEFQPLIPQNHAK